MAFYNNFFKPSTNVVEEIKKNMEKNTFKEQETIKGLLNKYILHINNKESDEYKTAYKNILLKLNSYNGVQASKFIFLITRMYRNDDIHGGIINNIKYINALNELENEIASDANIKEDELAKIVYAYKFVNKTYIDNGVPPPLIITHIENTSSHSLPNNDDYLEVNTDEEPYEEPDGGSKRTYKKRKTLRRKTKTKRRNAIRRSHIKHKKRTSLKNRRH